MAIDKPSLNDFLPNGFETQDKDGYKVNFDADKISAGYDKDTLEILSGPNLNNLLDNVGKNTHTLQQFLNFFRDMPIGSFPVVNTSNQLDYKSVNSFFRNVGEIVFSAIPLEDGNLRLLDGSLLEYTMTYSRFITYIAGYRTSLPNLFCTQAEFDQSVATYGVCGKFVYDTETKSLRLPKISGFIKGTLDSGSLGDVSPKGEASVTIPATGWGTSGSAPGTINSGKLVVGSGQREVDETLESLRAAGNDRTFQVENSNEPQAVKEFIYMVVSIDETEKQVLSAVYNYKGSVENYSDLPTAVAIGEVYNVIGEDPEGYSGANFAWTGEEWDRLGGTVNLSGYLTKTEAGNTYATKASLESNVDYLQGQINTNASNIANIASQEVIDTGIKKIEMLKFASTLGMGKVTDTDLFAVINKYKRSSFDRSKFTITGTPTITKDGIASGFSSGNYLKISNLISSANSWSIIIPVNLSSVSVDSDLLAGQSVNGIVLSVNSSGKLVFSASSNGTSWNIVQTKQGTTSLNANTNYLNKIEFTGTKYNIYNSVDGENWNQEITIDSTERIYNLQSLFIGIGRDGINRPTDGSIDLKQFSITVDGVEVFSGNKTGIDLVKPDNFTPFTANSANVNATLNTTTGIMSGFDTNVDYYNYTTPSYTKSITLEFGVVCHSLPVGRNAYFVSQYFGSSINYYSPQLGIDSNGKIVMFLLGKASDIDNTGINNFPLNQLVRFKVERTNDEYVKFYYKLENTDWILERTINDSAYTGGDWGNKVFRFGTGYTDTNYWSDGIIDLNYFKVYVDGNLVYQPCLKIPFHLSKTGLKVTDKLDRAIDMAEQCGFSQYFGLDEQNGLCLVPQGDNITGRRDLISRVEDSVTHYVTEIYSDLYCKQMGSGTATTAVTLDIPFKDANYKLSVPQNAKSKTGFTPTASCDWTAEGYIYLDEVI